MRLPSSSIPSVAAFAALLTITAFAQSTQSPPAAAGQGAHPHYARALTDLNLARALLEAPDKSPAHKFDKTAVDDIDQAMSEIKHAEVDDSTKVETSPNIDANVSHRDRLHEVESLLKSAGNDLNVDEDDKKALGWRAKAIKDTSDAQAFVVAAIHNEDTGEKK